MLMFVRNRFARGRVRTATKRSRVWIGTPTSFFQLAGGTTNFSTVVTEAQLQNLGKPTIARVLGELLINMDRSAEVAEDRALVGYGMTLVSNQAVAVGATAIPDPLNNAEWPWLMYGTTSLKTPTTLTEDEQGFRWDRVKIDSKSMRKAPPDHVLVFVVSVISVAGTPDIELSGFLRVLLLPS